MRSSGTSRGWLIHLAAGMALGAAVVLMVWIAAGGQPFGRIIGSDDVSAPTTAAGKTAAARRAVSTAKRSERLRSRPPRLVRAPELEFLAPKGERAAKAAKAKRARPAAQRERGKRPARKRRSPVVRVVSPPSGGSTEDEAPVAAIPDAAPTAAPKPAAPAPAGGAGGGSAKPAAPTYVEG